ncbi:Bug family tripartite tricarboxylate transporter substrate binding protein [Neoroseomonas soli]|uniref:Tripartite tricarboxylate transporter substrate binding protein n=1 Tax=Neoroseomonas soli TaxID=1081025 RepID=A0A9X9WXL1_9PROT|nr:tripartite tricarboxylate transporter substrate binding protein [Neoroseomonas soli]MBR0671890.1 tripartite tricarboxylate transporter substrate binding protein [Neoroseomonas soli]
MLNRRHLIALTPALLAAPALRAQPAFPNRPIRLLVGFAPGGTTDVAARLLAPRMQAALGQSVVIENRPGAGSNIATEAVVRSPADGHTLLLGTIGGLAVNPTLYGSLPYDPQTDLTAISRVAMILNVLAVPADRPWRSVAEVVTASRADALTFGTSGVGGAGHLAGEQLNAMARLQNTHVPYRGGGALISDFITGKVDMAFTPYSGVRPHAEAGRVRLLGVTTAARSRLAPDVPSIAETPGLAGFDMADWSTLMAPRGVPAPVVEVLNRAVTAALAEAQVVQALAERGIEATPSTPAECAAFIRSETEKWAPVVRASGATPN